MIIMITVLELIKVSYTSYHVIQIRVLDQSLLISFTQIFLEITLLKN